MFSKPKFQWFKRRCHTAARIQIFDAYIFGRPLVIGRDQAPNAGCGGFTRYFMSWNGGKGYIGGWTLVFNTPTRTLYEVNRRALRLWGPDPITCWKTHGRGILEINHHKLGGIDRRLLKPYYDETEGCCDEFIRTARTHSDCEPVYSYEEY